MKIINVTNSKFFSAIAIAAMFLFGTATVASAQNAISAVSITTQPASQTIQTGTTATFSVAVASTSAVSYQWSQNGMPIRHAIESTYTTPVETVAENNAKFTVKVTSGAGAVTSSAAVLTVNAPAVMLNASSSSVNFGSVNVSSDSTQNVTLSNAGNSTITISNVTVSGAGFNASGVSGGLMLTPGQTATLTASFAPSASGNMNGSVIVTSNATNSPASITLSGTGMVPVTHSANLSWAPDASSVIGYNTYVSTVSGGPYTKLTSTPVASTDYTDSAVQAGQTYYYVVTSVATGDVESAYSTQVSALIP